MPRSLTQVLLRPAEPPSAEARASLGASMARRLGPLAAGIPLALGAVVWLGERAHFFGRTFGLALFAFSTALGIAALIWRTARWLDQIDAGRRRAEAQLFAERRHAAALLAGQRDVLRKIATGQKLAATLEDLVLFAEAQAAGMGCSVLLFDAEKGRLLHGAAPSLPEAYNRLVDGVAIGPAVGSCGTAAFRREAVIVRDTATDPLWEPYRALAAQFGLAACWSTPIFGSDARLLGTFAMYYREPRTPEPEHRQLIEIITQTAAIAIERERAEAEIRALASGLERRVEERTRELEEANAELESFSYSVSHDLRAPLRHVHGYVELLQRATVGQLSEKAGGFMQTITAATAEMGELIDGLLAFSRMGRAEMKLHPVPLDGLLREVLRGLEMATRDRRIEWQIGPLPAVLGDAAMLKLVLANLVGNAVKYSRPRDPARIAIGCAPPEDGRVVVFVRDNGVGFDPSYAEKLFGVFQRLHRAEEFEGTGIGLATVRRIVARHGGTVRAEAAVERGATFYFSLRPAAPLASAADGEKTR